MARGAGSTAVKKPRAQRDDRHLTWLHLSDWHEGTPDLKDREVIRDRLLQDIRNRANIDPRLREIDFVVFSGDISFSGQTAQFSKAKRTLLDPIMSMLPDAHVVMAPGNHDFDRVAANARPRDLMKRVSPVCSALAKDHFNQAIREDFSEFRRPFAKFYRFCANYHDEADPESLVYTKIIRRGSTRISVTAINTALLTNGHQARHTQTKDTRPHWDYGVLAVSEQQLRDAIDQSQDSDIRILTMHHSLNWLHEEEQAQAEQFIHQNFDIVLHGHEHLPRTTTLMGNYGDICVVPAGSSYAGKLAHHPRYTNAYNFGLIEIPGREGTVFTRRWVDEKDAWLADERYWPNGVGRFVTSPSRLSIGHHALTYRFSAQKLYSDKLLKRPAKNIDVSLKHTPVVIDGKRFIQAEVRYVLELHPGEEEMFRYFTMVNKRVVENLDKSVRERAFTVIKMSPEPKRRPAVSQSMVSEVKLPSGATRVEYHYKMLEMEDGLWHFRLSRFADRVKFTFQESPESKYGYEYLSIGGFPDLPEPNGFLTGIVVESKDTILPHQGYIVQWYKKTPAVRAKKTRKASRTASARKKTRTKAVSAKKTGPRRKAGKSNAARR